MSNSISTPSRPSGIKRSGHPVVVVGGGVIGSACAHFLAQSGAPVLLLEKSKFGLGCSHGNCGFVSPSHILPLCRPGAIASSLKTLLQPNSPFQLRFQWRLSFWRWLLSFAQNCNQADMLRGGHARHALLMSSRRLYDQFFAEEVLTGCEWEAKGLLFVHRNQAHFEKFAETDALLRREFEQGAQRLEAAELLELEPALKPGIAGAWLYECDAHLRPDRLMDAWRRRLLADGVEIRENCELIGIEESDRSLSALVTTTGRIEIDQVVFATGAWSALLQDQLHVRIPIEPGKGYSITMRRPSLCPKYPMIFEDHRVAVTPFASGYRVGSTMEFAGFSKSIRQARLNLLTRGAKLYLREPLTEPIEEKWYGWRPMSCDGVPLIGRVPNLKNVWMAAGHSMLGVSMSPATGKLAAELMTGQTPHLDPQPYRLDRF